jgi:hypothetical protein
MRAGKQVDDALRLFQMTTNESDPDYFARKEAVNEQAGFNMFRKLDYYSALARFKESSVDPYELLHFFPGLLPPDLNFVSKIQEHRGMTIESILDSADVAEKSGSIGADAVRRDKLRDAQGARLLCDGVPRCNYAVQRCNDAVLQGHNATMLCRLPARLLDEQARARRQRSAWRGDRLGTRAHARTYTRAHTRIRACTYSRTHSLAPALARVALMQVIDSALVILFIELDDPKHSVAAFLNDKSCQATLGAALACRHDTRLA